MKYLLAYFLLACLVSCQTTATISQKNIDIAKYSSKLPDSLSALEAAGIDFYANGNNPVEWQLKANFDKNIYFKSGDGIEFNTTAIGAEMPSATALTYNVNTPMGFMKITIENENCTTQGSKKTTVLLQEKEYTGCGKYLYDYHINDYWILESFGSQQANASDFKKGLPYLLFNPTEKKITGNDGCNNFSMPFELQGKRIKFGQITGAEKSCKNNSVALLFKNKLSQHFAGYYFKNERLYLYLIDDSILIFKKRD